MKKFLNEKADINNPKWNNLIHREKEIYKRENDLRSDFERDYNRILHSNAYKRMKHKTPMFFSRQQITTNGNHSQMGKQTEKSGYKYPG